MIGENIKSARRAKGLSQEEMAVKLNVVRQTVSKWENGLSVPDANVLIQIADLLEVPVSWLLGDGTQCDSVQDLDEKLVQLEEELEAKLRQEKLNERAGRKRGLILFLSFISMLVALASKSEVVAIIAFGSCAIASLVILYKNLALLSGVAEEDVRAHTLRMTTVFDIVVIAIVVIITLLFQTESVTISEKQERLLAMCIIEAVILFAGFISARLPFNRHTGLRLPWTVQDEDTWNVAHRVLRYISLPVAVSYPAAALMISNFEAVSLTAILMLVGVPGVISLVFFLKKVHGKL